MGFFTSLAGIAAPLFLIASPILSYADQAISMHRAKSSAGFSLDIPLIMLVASMFRIFYYLGARYDTALLIQSFCNIFMQVILLKIALDHRPAPSSRGGEAAVPFVGSQEGISGMQRPYNFWKWRSPKPYWQFLLYLFIVLTVLELLIAPFESIYPAYSALTGYIGLSVEATLPLPQLYANAQSKSCKGFRFSVLASWIVGDSMKMFWFFTATTEIPLAFKLCGVFQAICDALIGVQYFIYGNQSPAAKAQQDYELAAKSSSTNGWQTPVGRRTPIGEKSVY
ncbi:putative pq loop repeat protein [Rosellinia necatrix]|uniref:Putative pq loop repeat protein n=1 Tax=Rosellinia necatrix TaxID=77044 RepID=A0A1S7UM36_ROSNE|nr:putative pq loop repeat protein [Rosellinia necatrix]